MRAIHHYVPGYLVAEARGAMPLCFRCLSPEQPQILDMLVRRREQEPAATA